MPADALKIRGYNPMLHLHRHRSYRWLEGRGKRLLSLMRHCQHCHVSFEITLKGKREQNVAVRN